MSRPDRYGLVAMLLHWVIALGIGVQLLLGLYMVQVERSLLQQYQLYQLHKSIGITVLVLVGIRLGWRIMHRPPRLPNGMPRWEVAVAHGTHHLLYAMMLAIPLSGWALVSAATRTVPTKLFKLIPWPHLPVLSTLADKAPVEAALQWIHAWLAWTIILLIGLHAGAALRHHWRGDGILLRMLPFWRRRFS